MVELWILLRSGAPVWQEGRHRRSRPALLKADHYPPGWGCAVSIISENFSRKRIRIRCFFIITWPKTGATLGFGWMLFESPIPVPFEVLCDTCYAAT